MRLWRKRINGKHPSQEDLDRKAEQETVRAQILLDRMRILAAAHDILIKGKISELRAKVGE